MVKSMLFWMLFIIGLIMAGSEGLDGSPTVFNFIGVGMLFIGLFLCNNNQ